MNESQLALVVSSKAMAVVRKKGGVISAAEAKTFERLLDETDVVFLYDGREVRAPLAEAVCSTWEARPYRIGRG